MAKGTDGKGVTIAIVDAYDSPTLLSDSQKYFRLNDPAHPLKSSQFTNVVPRKVDAQIACAGSGWFAEQALDVQSSHTMAPGAPHPVRRGQGLLRQQPARGGHDRDHQRRLGGQQLLGRRPR